MVIDNKKYGVLVSQGKYDRFYKKAKGTFKKDSNVNNWIKEELAEFLDNNQNTKKDFLNGISIKV
ncbi:hypothetical protein ES707_13722 [subsurface metagenome]